MPQTEASQIFKKMAKERFGGPAFDTKPRYQLTEEMATAHLVALTKPYNGKGYRTMAAILDYAERHGRDRENTETRVEDLLDKGYAELSGGRLVKLTKKGRNLIKHLT